MKNIQFIFQRISLLLLFSIISSHLLFAQDFSTKVKAKTIKNYFKSTTYFVLDNDPFSEYNMVIDSILNKHWYQTDYKLITSGEFEKARKDEFSSFVYFSDAYFEEDKTHTQYDYLFLSMGHPTGNLEYMKDLVSIPLAINGTHRDDYFYKFGMFLQFMQYHTKWVLNHTGYDGKQSIKAYMHQEVDLGEYTLLLQSSEVDKGMNNKAKFADIYPYPYRFVTQKEVEEAVDKKMERTLVMHIIEAGDNKYCVKFIADTGSGNLVFYDYHKAKTKSESIFRLKDVKKLIK